MKQALVTGTSSGIGAEIARMLLADGWQVIGLARRDVTIPDAGKRYQHLSVDLLNREQLITALQDIPVVDAIVQAAGMMASARVGEFDYALSEQLWKLHVSAAEILVNELVGKMPDGGRIVLIGSRVANGKAGRSQYAATKSALRGMVRSWAAELAPRHITANIVAPAATETAMLHDPNRKASLPQCPPMGRFIHPDEIAGMVQYLLSDKAGAVTGQEMLICGGASL
jgi:3-oxoacyl-[acyl-carrier protein] reductase